MKKSLIFVIFLALNLNAIDLNDAINSAKILATSQKSGDYKTLVINALNASVNELSKNGFLNNKTAKIPLPSSLQTAANLAKKVGGEKWANELSSQINQSATKAVGGASNVFLDVIKNMSDDDIKKAFSSGFTKYLQENSSQKLSAVFKPIISEMMSKNSFATAYNGLNSYVKGSDLLKGETAKNIKNLASNFGASEYIPNGDEDLNDYITRKTLDGLFAVMGEKESSLRGSGTKILGDFLK